MAKRPPNLKIGTPPKRRGWTVTTKGTRKERGYGWDWEKRRERILKRDKRLCQPCLRNGIVKTADAVDHKRPKHLGGTDDDDNLESTCDPCHAAKTAREGRAARR